MEVRGLNQTIKKKLKGRREKERRGKRGKEKRRYREEKVSSYYVRKPIVSMIGI